MEIKEFTVAVDCFCPEQIFECGQCFRWNRDTDGGYTGVVGGKALRVCETDAGIRFENTDSAEFDSVWRTYFDLDTDYGEIQRQLSDGAIMDEAIACGKGIRILRQDSWEALLSFILSSNNNIVRIKGMIERLCQSFGKPIEAFGKVFYTFPTAKELDGIEKADLACLSAGYRDKFLVDAVKKVNSGEIDLAKLQDADYITARTELMKISGVGPKVADCAVLFGLGRKEAFPVDVWMRRVLEKLYDRKYSPVQASDFARNTFGERAGIAQQYLFYYMRTRGRQEE